MSVGKSGKLQGIFAAMVTPFKEDSSVNYDMAQKLADHIVSNGVDGILPCGSTGEYPLLALDERVALFTAVQQVVGNRGVVLANVSSLLMQETKAYIAAARNAGIHHVSVVAPSYYDFDQKALFTYFKWVCDEAEDLAVYLYNIPSNTKNSISANLLKELSESCSNLRGIKDSSMDFMTYTDYQRAGGNKLSILTGNDAQILCALQACGDGALVATAGVLPKIAKRLMTCFENSDIECARKCQSILYDLRSICRGFIPVVTHKLALEVLGFNVGKARMPFRSLNSEERERAIRGIERLKEASESLQEEN